MTNRFVASCVLLALAAWSGCTMRPFDGERIAASGVVSFVGYTLEPGVDVHAQALNRFTGQWQTLVTFKARTTPASLGVTLSQPLYQFNGTVDIPDTFFDGAGTAGLRVEQAVGVSWVPTFMYDKAGFDCVVARYGAAVSADDTLDVRNTGMECSTRKDIRVQR